MTSTTVPDGVEVLAPADGASSPDALALVARLQRELGPTRTALPRDGGSARPSWTRARPDFRDDTRGRARGRLARPARAARPR